MARPGFVAPPALGLDLPAHGAAAVTPNDSADLPSPGAARRLYIGGTGALKVTTVDGDTVTFAAVPVGIFDVSVSRVWATGTAATNIVALY